MTVIKKKVVKKIVKNPVPSQKVSLIEKIENQKIRETVQLVKKMGIKINYNINLTRSKEIEEYFIGEIGNYLNEKYNEVHERVSELRKFGYDGTVWGFKLMVVPLKIKIFLSTGDKKDFNNVTRKLNEVLQEVLVSEKKKKEKETQKEFMERKKERIEKLKQDKKTKTR